MSMPFGLMGRGFGRMGAGRGKGGGWWLPGTGFDFNLQTNLAAINGIAAGSATSHLAITRATGGMAQQKNGLWVPFSAGQFRQTDKGLLVELASENGLAQSRDMTQTAWTKGATMTVALNQVGIDGAANTATLLTGGATSATNTALQATTIVSGVETYSVWLKRVSGTGTVNITLNGGSSWTPVTLTSTYQQFQITATLANPSVGIQVVTPGDQVAADANQLEGGIGYATSPIFTTTVGVLRNADVVTMAAPGLVSNLGLGTWFGEWQDDTGAIGAGNRSLVNATNGSLTSLIFSAVTSSAYKPLARLSDGSTLANVPIPANGPTAAGIYRIATALTVGDQAAAYSLALEPADDVLTNNLSPTISGAPASVNIGSNATGGALLSGYVRQLAWSPSRVPNAQLLAWATSAVGP